MDSLEKQHQQQLRQLQTENKEELEELQSQLHNLGNQLTAARSEANTSKDANDKLRSVIFQYDITHDPWYLHIH